MTCGREFFTNNEWERDEQGVIWYVNAVTTRVFTEADFSRFMSMHYGRISVSTDDYDYSIQVMYNYRNDNGQLVSLQNKKLFAYVEYLCLKMAGVSTPCLLGKIDTDTDEKIMVYMHPWIRGKFEIAIDDFAVSSASLKDLFHYWESLYNLVELSVPTYSERFML